MMRPDLHLHTTASDGVFTPSQVAQMIQKADVTFFSITDHDTISGLQEACDAAYDRGLAFLPGIEISAEGEEEVHILGYGVKQNDPQLIGFLDQMAQERRQRIIAMGEKLGKLGFSLPLDEIAATSGKIFGRPMLARAMMQKGYVSSVQEGFERYLGRGCPAFVPREKLPASQVISMLRDHGAVPVLAHPESLHWPMERIIPLLNAWQNAGLMGIEVYHPANYGRFTHWDRIARQRGLLVTGGSDFHDSGSHHGQIGEMIEQWPSAGDDAWALYRAANH